MITPVKTMGLSVRRLPRSLKRGLYLYHRFRSLYSYRNDVRPSQRRPLVSFTFDDIPVSAALGADILNGYGVRGTFYAAFGLAGRQTLVGEISGPDTIERLARAGHEIGDHTFDHSDALEVTADGFEASIRRNRDYLESHFAGLEFATFAYPFGSLEFRTKRIAQAYYRCSRSAWKGINHGRIDLNLLRSYPLSGSIDDLPALKALLDRNRALNGWLIFLTHDVRPDPSPCGCTSGLLEEVLRYAIGCGTTVATVDRACSLLIGETRAS